MADSARGYDRRVLETLERLLEITAADRQLVLARCADLISPALRADKVDAFVYEPARDSLVALGSSSQPLSALQRLHGLDVMPRANAGRTVQVYETGATFVSGAIADDPEELRGVRLTLRIQSELGVPLRVGDEVRGVLLVASQTPDFFTSDDVRFTEIVARWVGVVAHRAELAEASAREALEQGHRSAAEELVLVLAHDLRNHLSPLDFRVSALAQRAQRDARTHDLQDAERARASIGRINQLVGELLDLARIDRGMLDIEHRPVRIGALVEEAATALATSETPVHVRITEELVVEADPARIRQCVENLVANAVKHSPRRVATNVSISREVREDGSWARVDIRDEGPGVPPEVLPRIFDRFVTGHPQGGGLGLGLYIAKRIAMVHGGELSVETAKGRGACFTLALPCQAPLRAERFD